MSQRWRLSAALALIGIATLVPIGSAPPRFGARLDMADAIVNIALFLPLGLILERHGWRRVVLLALLVSIAVEVLQGYLIPGRRGSGLDVGFNLAGALAGLYWRRTPTAVLALPLLPWIASGALLRPAAPRTPTWYGQWAHPFPGTTPFDGRILSVRLLGHAVQDGPIDSTAGLVRAVDRNGITFEVELIAGNRVDSVSHLVGVADGEGHVIVALEQSGSDLILTWQSRGASLGLRAPVALFPEVLALEAGERVRLGAEIGTGSASVTVEAPGLSEARVLRFTPTSGWRSFLTIPSRNPAWPARFSALWTALAIGYAALVIYHTARRRKPRVN